MVRHRKIPNAGLVGIAWMLACASSFKVSQFPTSESLYAAGVRQFQARHWGNAIQVFEKLTLELPVRDTLLPRSHFYLGEAHARRGEHLLAAQEYLRLSESFPTDSLAADAQYQAGLEYQLLWRRPDLDAKYGGAALATYQTMLSLYPDSPLRDSALKQIGILSERYATKDYQTGMYYLRRKAYDPALIYFRSVVDRYPDTARVHDAYLRLAEVYDRIKYKQDKAEVCATLHERYPRDGDVSSVCGPPVTEATPPRPPSARDSP